mmetsp:Transcript_177034/g.567815  ORF Transcript_177034/g.567815 Transcript_177034/m.567815 type:complete len:792 (+) Transcript_177034:78-2453(+)
MLGLVSPIVCAVGSVVSSARTAGRLVDAFVGGAGGSMSAGDEALLQKAYAQMPAGSLRVPFLSAEGHLQQAPWPLQGGDAEDAATASGSGVGRPSESAGTVVRRVGEAILDELGRYFQARDAHGAVTSRSVFAGKLGHWAAQIRRRNPPEEEVHWWVDFLLRVEDDRLFTRSNWVNASEFGAALMQVRRVLADLKVELEKDREDASLQRLREQLQDVYANGREAADRLMELLNLALRPSVERANVRAILEQLDKPAEADASRAIEDRFLLELLQLERRQLVDEMAEALGQHLVPSSAAAVEPGVMQQLDDEDAEHEDEDDLLHIKMATCAVGPVAQRRCSQSDGQPQQRPLQVEEAQLTFLDLRSLLLGDGSAVSSTAAVAPSTRVPPEMLQAVGRAPVDAFLELHRLYCLFVGLLQRVDLTIQAVREYASFVCFLPMHRVSMLDLKEHLPELRRRLSEASNCIVLAYEKLDVVPGGHRQALFGKNRDFLKGLNRCLDCSGDALERLQQCTPRSTLQGFKGWQSGDQRWLQVARFQVAAQALLPSGAVAQARDVAADLRRFHAEPAALLDGSLDGAGERRRGELPAELQEGAAASGCRQVGGRVAQGPGDAIRFGLGYVVDEDTRLHALACTVAALGLRSVDVAATAGHRVFELAKPGCEQASRAALKQLDAWLQSRGVSTDDLGEYLKKSSTVLVEYARNTALGPEPYSHLDILDGQWVLLDSLQARGRSSGGGGATPLLAAVALSAPFRIDFEEAVGPESHDVREVDDDDDDEETVQFERHFEGDDVKG